MLLYSGCSGSTAAADLYLFSGEAKLLQGLVQLGIVLLQLLCAQASSSSSSG